MTPTSRITSEEGLSLLKNTSLLELGMLADKTRHELHPESIVTFIIDRNINYTNICINQCAFCAFWKNKEDPEAYVLSKEELFKKIEETIQLGGTQILLQGGLHPDMGIDYYISLLQSIKQNFSIHIHGFSPPEIHHISKKAGLNLRETIKMLKEAGLDSIPGGGAEILSDRVRKKISPRKIGKDRWLEIMQEAHNLGMKTTATMMFGSIEEPEDIIEHLDAVRQLQDSTKGFTAFIPWSFQPWNTELGVKSLELRVKNSKNSSLLTGPALSLSKGYASRFYPATAVEYLRILALSRVYLDNIPNIQVSWVTQGIKMAQIALRFGANDFGSTMIEENVVRATGLRYMVSLKDIIWAIKEVGFKPAKRDMYYNIINIFH